MFSRAFPHIVRTPDIGRLCTIAFVRFKYETLRMTDKVKWCHQHPAAEEDEEEEELLAMKSQQYNNIHVNLIYFSVWETSTTS